MQTSDWARIAGNIAHAYVPICAAGITVLNRRGNRESRETSSFSRPPLCSRCSVVDASGLRAAWVCSTRGAIQLIAHGGCLGSPSAPPFVCRGHSSALICCSRSSARHQGARVGRPADGPRGPGLRLYGDSGLVCRFSTKAGARRSSCYGRRPRLPDNLSVTTRLHRSPHSAVQAPHSRATRDSAWIRAD
jgi:hypothetical protein